VDRDGVIPDMRGHLNQAVQTLLPLGCHQLEPKGLTH
jgi:hypothetical protein